MALYKVQSPYNAALQGMQGAAGTASGMTKKQEVKEQKKSFGGALGSMVAGGSYGLGMADMFTGGEATKGLWSGIQGAFGGGGQAAGQAAVSGALAEFAPTVAAGAPAAASGVPIAATAAEELAAGTGAGVTAATTATTTAATTAAGAELAAGGAKVAGAASAAGPIGWGLLGAGALVGLASYYL